MAPDVSAAIPLDPYVVRVVFADGEIRDVDIEPLLSGPVFAPLRDPEAFRQVAVNPETGSFGWPTGAELDPDVVYGNERPASGPAARISTPSLRRAGAQPSG
jgi:hypothetical protein